MLERLLEQTLHPPTTEANKESETKRPPVRFCLFQFELIRKCL